MTHTNSEQMLLNILDYFPDAVMITDLEGIVLDCNRATLELHGYASKEEFVGNSAFVLTPEYERKRAVSEFARAKQEGKVKSLEFMLLRKGNEEFPAEISAGVIRNAEGVPFGLAIISKDITDRKKTAEALREREASLQSIFRTIPAGIGVVSKRVLLKANESLCAILGYGPEELTGKSARQLYPNELEYDLVGRDLYRQIDEAGTGTVETRWMRKDGTIIDILLTAAPLKPETTATELAFAAIDITDRKRAEEELKIYRTFSETAGQGFGFADMNGVVTYANLALLRLVGLDRAEEMIGTNVAMYYPKAVARNLVTEIFPEVSREGGWVGELPLKSVKGTITPTIQNIFVIRGPDGTPTHFGNVLTNIAEQKEAEEALRESKERFDKVTQQSREIVWQVDAGGRFTYISPASEEILGYRPEEVIGKMHFYDLHPKQGRNEFKRAAHVLMAQKRNFSNTINTVETKTGAIVMLSSSGMSILDEAGNLKGYVGADLDITERQRAEDALRESEERFRRIFEEGALGMVTTRADFRFLRANAAFCRMVGYSEKELTALTFREITHPEHVAQDIESVKRLVRGEIPLYRTEKRYIRKDKGIIWANTVVSVVRNKEGKFLYSLAMIEDITERKQAERELWASEKRLSSIYDAAGDVIFMIATVDGRFRFESVNHAFVRVTGLSKDSIEGKYIEEVIPESSLSLVLGNYRKAVREQKIVQWEEVSSYPTGTLIGIVTVAPVIDERGGCTHLVGTVHDITERKQAEDKLREATEKLKIEHKALLEKNIALKEFLEHMNQGKEDFKHEISSSVYNLLYPVVKELRKTGGHLAIRQIDQLENNIKSIVKKDLDEFKLNYDRLTAREMEICELIRKGMSSKEIAELLNIARETVHKHREAIRRKLQLRGKGINLPAFLKSRSV